MHTFLMLNGKYAEALDLCDRSVSEASSLGVGQVMNFLAHFGALSANLIIFSPHWTIWKSVADYQRWQKRHRIRTCRYIGC